MVAVQNGLIGWMKGAFAELTGTNGFVRMDSVLLKTTLLLAAVEGEIAAGEIVRFKELAAKCRGYSGESFEVLWDAALRNAGCLLLRSHLLGHDELVAAFVKEAGKSLAGRSPLGAKFDK